MARPVGFEPTTFPLGGGHSNPAELRAHEVRLFEFVARLAGLEPATRGLEGRCSDPAELQAH